VHETTLSLSYESPAEAETVLQSLRQEAGTISGDRTEATVTGTDRSVTITIRAEDLVALRAGHNTWLGLAAVAERTLQAVPE
jgi:KEOPS complex subunit Pcc1